MMVKRDLAILVAACLAVFGLTSVILAMSPKRLVRTAGLCGNLTCEYDSNETNLTCPSDCKALVVDPTHAVEGIGVVARLYSDDIYEGGEKWFIDSNGVATHDGPYPPQITTNGHGYPFNIPAGAAAGPARIELRSANSPDPRLNVVEAWLPFTIDPAAACVQGTQCNSNAQCGNGTCSLHMVCSNNYGLACSTDGNCPPSPLGPGRCVVDVKYGKCANGATCGFDGASTIACQDGSVCQSSSTASCQCPSGGGTCELGRSCTNTSECGGGVCNGAGKWCEISGVTCDTGVCQGVPQTCQIGPDGKGFCSLSRAMCTSDASCAPFVPTCVQKIGACQQCPSPTPVCGNGTCEAGEDALNCAADCGGSTCREGSLCSSDAQCGTGSCKVSGSSRCDRSGLACKTDTDCGPVTNTCISPAAPASCLYQPGNVRTVNCSSDAQCVDPKFGQGVCAPIPGNCSASGTVCVSDSDCAPVADRCLSSVGGSCSCTQVHDADNDGVEDSKDLCPATEAGATVDANGCSDDQVDTDADGVCNISSVSAGPSACVGKDQCETVKGTVEMNGCPGALRVSVQIVDALAKAKIDQSLPTRIYDASDGSCADTIGMETPLNYHNIFQSCVAENKLVLLETNSLNRVVAELTSFGVTTGPKFVLVESPVSTNGSVDYQAFNVTVSSGKTYNLGFEITPATATNYVENSYFSRDSKGNYHGARKQTITGSILEILSPDYSLWMGNQEVYPFILISDSDWTVDVCLDAPSGYKVVNGEPCTQVIMANEMKVIEFTVADVGSPEPNMKARIKAVHKGKTTNLKQDLKGFRVKARSQAAAN